MSAGLLCGTQLKKAMQRRYFPARRSDSILLYGFGLALLLSLVFNGFLLHQQSRQRLSYDYELSNAGLSADNGVWQQQLSECQRASQQKDSLIFQLEQASNAPSGQGAAARHTASN